MGDGPPADSDPAEPAPPPPIGPPPSWSGGEAPRARSGAAVVLVCTLAILLLGAVAVIVPLTASGRATETSLGPSIDDTAPGVAVDPPQPLPSATSSSPTQWSIVGDGESQTTPVAGGVSLALTTSGNAESYRPEGPERRLPALRVGGQVQMSSGAEGNALGLGCRSQSGVNYWFFIHDDGVWSFDDTAPTPSGEVTLLARRPTTAIYPITSTNELTVVCSRVTDGTARFMLAINGHPVADLTYPVSPTSWLPIIAQCSPDGPDDGVFTDVTTSPPAAA